LRIALFVLALVLALLVGGLLVVPHLGAWEDYRGGLSRQAEAFTGQKVAIRGPIELRLLPRPTLSLADAILGPTLDDPLLKIERLDLQLEPLSLLRGELQVDEVRLVRPIVYWRAAPDGRPEFPEFAPLPDDPQRPSELTVVDGRVVLRRADGTESTAVEQAAFELIAEGQGGPYAVDGELGIAGQPFVFDARLGRIGDETSASLQLDVRAPVEDSTASASFRGLLAWPEDLPRLEGELGLHADDARAAIAMLGGIAGRRTPSLPTWAAAPLRMEAQLYFGDDRLRLDQAQLEIVGHYASGQLDLAIAPQPTIDLVVNLDRVDLPDRPDVEDLGLAVAAALPPELSGEVDLSVDALGYRDGVVRRLRATLLLSGSGRLTVEQARALLPGRADVSFTGVLVADAADVELHGTLTAVTNDLRSGLAWLGIQPDNLPDDRLRSLSLSGALSADRESVRLAEADIRVDATRITGSAAIGLGPRRQIAAVLAADRLNLDAYRPEWAPDGLATALRDWLGDLDLALKAEIGRLIAGGRHLEQVTLDARALGGRVAIEELVLQSAAEARMRLSGEVDLEGGHFDLAASLEAERPTSLLRRLGADPPLILARLTPLALRGSARGTLEAFDLDLELRHEAARIAVSGEAGWTEGEARYDLALDAGHPDLPQLLHKLGVVYGSSGQREPKAFSLTGKLQRAPGAGTTVVGSARLGATSLTGRVDWRATPGRPRVSAQLSLGEPQPEDLLALASLTGVRLQPPLIEEPPVGDWPRDALLLAWMNELDGELELSAKGGLVGPGLQLTARLEDRRLMIDELTASLWGGDVEIQALLDARRRLPFLAIAVDLRAVDPTRLGEWLDLAPVVEGSADLYLEATAAGSSLRELVRSLIGRVDVTVRDGRLSGVDGVELRKALHALPGGLYDRPPDRRQPVDPTAPIPLDRLAGSFQVKRGIASAESVRLALDGIEGRLVGDVDLLIWAADLKLELTRRETNQDGAVVLQLVGPLGRPQVRLQQPQPAHEVPDPP
jgi:hypothetical protein